MASMSSIDESRGPSDSMVSDAPPGRDDQSKVKKIREYQFYREMFS